MALKLDYVVGETVGNLRRNFLMSSAAILTVAVSLSLVGGALLLRQGVQNATIQWRGGVDLSIFMHKDTPQSQIDAIGTELSNLPEVKSWSFVDKEAAYEEAKRLFASQPDILDSLTVETMPPSFRVVPTNVELVRSIGERFEKEAGVRDVAYAQDQINKLLTVTRVMQVSLLAIAGVLLISATLLILNTIRIAIFARRREVSVMKLVGATNWFIRIPFMFEGMLQGLFGAAVACMATLGLRNLMPRLAESEDFSLINRLVVSPEQAVWTGAFVIVVGIVVGIGGSLVAVHRFLDT